MKKWSDIESTPVTDMNDFVDKFEKERPDEILAFNWKTCEFELKIKMTPEEKAQFERVAFEDKQCKKRDFKLSELRRE